MNCDAAKDLCRTYFGDYHDLPTIESICDLANSLADTHGRGNVVLWKTDLRAAFTLLKFSADFVHLLTTRLMSGLIFVCIQGNFGWTGMPFAFQVVVRVLLVCITHQIRGRVQMYVDDLIGGSHIDHWPIDRDASIRSMNSLLGPDAEEPTKRESTADPGNTHRSIVILGWEFRLSSWTVDVARRNRLKALFLFWATNIDEPITLQQMEAMCSMAYRYSRVYRELTVFMPDLYAALPRWRRRFHTHRLQPRTQTAIRLWRAHLVLAEITYRANGAPGRPMDSFRHHPHNAVVEFDGSPKGVGFRIFSVTPHGEQLLAEWGALITYDLRNDPQYQNTMELAAATCGLFRTAQLRPPTNHPLCVLFRGDSEVALSWLHADQTRSPSTRARGAALLLSTLLSDHRITLAREHTHISKDINTRADALSRGIHLDDCDPSVPITWASQHPLLLSLMDLCNPLTLPTDEVSYINRMRDTIQLCTDLIPWFRRA